MDIFEYCLACLVTDVKMIKFSPNVMSSTIGEEILHFLRSPLKEDGSNYFCFECAAFLYKSEKFRSKCERAQAVLLRLKEEKNQLTKKTLQNINRNQFILTSNLAVNVIETTSLINGYNNAEDTTFDIKPNTEYNVEENPIKNEFQQETLDHENYNLDTLNAESTEESFNHKSKLKKTNKKDFKTKKRKPPESSDDEPLINKVTKKLNVEKKPRKSFNISYFEDYATVDFLSLDDAKKEMLLRKESSNYINSAFKCDFCYRGFEAKGTFDNHMRKHSSDYGEFVCDICHLRFQEQRCLCKHKLASHKRKFTCKLCSYVCFCTHQAKTHVSLHKGKKYPCKECGEIFSMPNSLLMHKRLKHQTECVCDMCGDMFATTRGLYSHRVKVHRQDKNVKNGPKCEDCNIHFANEASWKRHLVLSSKHNVSNGCRSCGETFANSEDLKNHMRLHARKHTNRSLKLKLPSACTICNKWLVDRTEFNTHMTSQHPLSDITKKLNSEEIAPFVCEFCGRTFKKSCILSEHQRTHTQSRPLACNSCDKRFPRASSLYAHKAVHSNRTYKCRLCERCFTYKSALNKHMKMHLNIRPHRCDICDKSFISPCDVRIHVKYVHNKVPWPKRDRNKKNIVQFE